VGAATQTPRSSPIEVLDGLIAEQEAEFLVRRPLAAEWADRARRSLAGGVTSSWQISRPEPIWISHGRGSRVVDVDGNEYVDLHGGYGAMLAGHAHPAVVAAVQERLPLGTHFAQPVADAAIVAEELARRFGLPLWRFCNSGTEATMDAVHLMRTVTGRDLIVKFEGTYHGHHDSVQVSVWVEDDLGPARRPNSVVSAGGIPNAIVELTKVAPFNDLDAVAGIFAEHPGAIAGVIVEPVAQNCGIVHPEPGFLEGLRELTRCHGALLTFDEVKTGFTLGPGGATRHFGVTPDLICLAKSLGGGLPMAAIGGTSEVMAAIEHGDYEQVGTFNGWPLGLAAARAMLTEVLTDVAYARLNHLQQRMRHGAERVIATYGLPAYVETAGAKGCVTYSTERVRNYRDFLRIDDRYAHCAWLYQFNGGVFLPPWGKGEQWLLSVQHTDDDVDCYLATLDRFAAALCGT
jgi:glutamate-1-semialdehyde 2,1-aminomutase